MFPPTVNELRSVQVPRFISIVRLPALGILALLSIITLAAGAHITYESISASLDASFGSLAVASPILTFLTVVPSIVVSHIIGATPMYILIENVWLGILWTLWLGTASYSVSDLVSCDIFDASISCNEIQAVQSFAWLNWLTLTGYVPTVFVLLFLSIAQTRKSHVQPVQPVTYPNQQTMYPPQQQQIGTPLPVYQQPMTSYVPPQN